MGAKPSRGHTTVTGSQQHRPPSRRAPGRTPADSSCLAWCRGFGTSARPRSPRQALTQPKAKASGTSRPTPIRRFAGLFERVCAMTGSLKIVVSPVRVRVSPSPTFLHIGNFWLVRPILEWRLRLTEARQSPKRSPIARARVHRQRCFALGKLATWQITASSPRRRSAESCANGMSHACANPAGARWPAKQRRAGVAVLSGPLGRRRRQPRLRGPCQHQQEIRETRFVIDQNNEASSTGA
jgi:hypothetical protein